MDVPTDCPQRDERLGWTGDAQAFFNTAGFNMDVKNFFDKWLIDLTYDQRSDGAVPGVVPHKKNHGFLAQTWDEEHATCNVTASATFR